MSGAAEGGGLPSEPPPDYDYAVNHPEEATLPDYRVAVNLPSYQQAVLDKGWISDNFYIVTFLLY